MTIIVKTQTAEQGLDEFKLLVIKHRLYTPTGEIRHIVLNPLSNIKLISIAFDEGIPVGVCTFSVDDFCGDTRNVVNTWVKPSMRKKGIGRTLVSESRKLVDGYVYGYFTKKIKHIYKEFGISLWGEPV